jgi:Zn-dependent peptidase ImmA (M78 family)/transcriptional regulator with XRE-family HTH domain
VSADDARATASIFDPQRLKVARQVQKLTRAALADRVQVSPTAVGQWESGAVRPRPQKVADLAAALHFPVAYFATSGRQISNLDGDCTFFRSLRKSSQVDRDAAMGHAALIAELAIVIERHAELPSVTIPLKPVETHAELEEIDEIAHEVREAWGLGLEPVGDVLRELERHGSVAARLELADAVDAFSWPGIGRPIVILGTDKSNRIRSRFDAAHELGHLVLHRDHPKPGDPQLERQAHRFASAFLLPRERLLQEWPRGRVDWRRLMPLKRRWQMSLAALLYRARQDQLVTETAYESATKYMSRAGWRKTEPGDLGPPEEPRLLRRAVDLLAAAGTSMTELAEEARLPEKLVQLYLRPHVPTRVPVEL